MIKCMLLLFLDPIGPAVYHRRCKCMVAPSALPCCILDSSSICESIAILVPGVMVNGEYVKAVDMVEFF